MPDKDGFITPAESARLEAQAEALLKEDARNSGLIRENGRGFSEYARANGITTKKTLETTFKHEKVGFTEDQLEYLHAQEPAVRRSRIHSDAPDSAS